MLETCLRLNVVLANPGRDNIYQRRELQLVVDVIFVSAPLDKGLQWYISKEGSHGDLQTIIF